MADTLPFALLAKLFSADDAVVRDRLWAEFVNASSKLMLRTAHSFGGGYDAAMNRYAFMLEQLQRDDFHKLRAFRPEGCGKLSTWLVVVARRLCLDHERQQYGRLRSLEIGERDLHRRRRRLVDLAVDDIDVSTFASENLDDALTTLCVAEVHSAVERALASFTPRERLLIKLRFEDGLSAAAVARIMTFPTPFHVYRKSAQLLTVLRQSLTQQGIELTTAAPKHRTNPSRASISQLRAVP